MMTQGKFDILIDTLFAGKYRKVINDKVYSVRPFQMHFYTQVD